MSTEEDIINRFASRGIFRGGELYLNQENSLEFITVCGEADLAVIGVEAFLYVNGDLISQIDLIADYSSSDARNWVEYRQRCNEYSKSFVKNVTQQGDVYLSLTVLSRDEYYPINP